MNSRWMKALTVVALVVSWSAVEKADAVGTGLVVHEWGVAIRQHTASGVLLSSPAELVSGLPAFVTRQKSTRTLEPQGWDKPVIWFYGPDQTKISVTVMAEKGFATASFPKAQVLTRRFSHIDRKAQMVSLLTETAGFRWDGTLTKEPTGKVPAVAKEHWWQTARDAGGLYFNAAGTAERFLFYEATAFQEPTVSARVSADAITVRNSDELPSGPVILLANTGGNHFVRVIESVGANAAVKVNRDEMLKEAVGVEAVLTACAAQWASCGMTDAESKAIVQVWREDLLKPDNFLLISRLPPKLYAAIFSLTIEPAPTELVRVGMVFDALHDQWDAASWIPARKKDFYEPLMKAAADLGSPDFRTREEASRELAHWGREAKGLLEKLAQSPDPEIKVRAKELLEKIPPPAVDIPARAGVDSSGVMIQP